MNDTEEKQVTAKDLSKKQDRAQIERFEALRFEVLKTSLGMDTCHLIPDHVAYAWSERIYPIGIEEARVNWPKPKGPQVAFEASFEVSRDEMREIFQFLDISYHMHPGDPAPLATRVHAKLLTQGLFVEMPLLTKALRYLKLLGVNWPEDFISQVVETPALTEDDRNLIASPFQRGEEVRLY